MNLRDLFKASKPSKCEADGHLQSESDELEQNSLESEESLLSLKDSIFEYG